MDIAFMDKNSIAYKAHHRSIESMSLFKYLPPERTDIFKNQKLRFTPANEFNDPFEFAPDISVLRDKVWAQESEDRVLQAAMSAANLKPDVSMEQVLPLLKSRIREIQQETLDEVKRDWLDGLRPFREKLRVLCLSRLCPSEPEALLLWAHYTKGHSGFVVELDESAPWLHPTIDNGFELDGGEINYSEIRPVSAMDTVARDYYLVKSTHWDYEREFRLVRLAGDPALDANSLVYFPASVVRAVTFGVEASNQTKTEILSFLRSNPDFRHTRVFQATMSAARYQLEAKEIRSVS